MASIKPVNSHPECSRSLNSDAMAPFVAKTREVSPLETKTPEPFSARVVFRLLIPTTYQPAEELSLGARSASPFFRRGFWGGTRGGVIGGKSPGQFAKG